MSCGAVTLDQPTLEALLEQSGGPGGWSGAGSAGSGMVAPEPTLTHEPTTDTLGELPPPDHPISNPPPPPLNPSLKQANIVTPRATPARILDSSSPPSSIPSPVSPLVAPAHASGHSNTLGSVDDEVAAFQREQALRQRILIGVALVAVVLLCVAVGLFAGVWQSFSGSADANQVPSVPDTELQEVLTAVPDENVEVEVEVPPEPEPEPEPEPQAQATAAPRPTMSAAPRLIRQGWNTVGTDPQGAAQLFQQAMDQSPNNSEAAYGYGYAMLKLGNPSAARPFLCKAILGDDVEVQRDVRSLLERNSLTCN